jgi:hypothetical protein
VAATAPEVTTTITASAIVIFANMIVSLFLCHRWQCECWKHVTLGGRRVCEGLHAAIEIDFAPVRFVELNQKELAAAPWKRSIDFKMSRR